MRLFHYTTIDTLAHIMNNRSLKFNRLDQLDDITESEPFAAYNPLQYIFSCSFTYDPIENIPLWRMYANMETGIRLEFDANKLFELKPVHLKMPSHSRECCEFPLFLYTAIKSENILNDDYTLMHWSITEEDSLCSCIKLKKIEYIDDFKEKYKSKLIIHDVKQSDGSIYRSLKYEPTDFGFYKSRYWEFQKEIRCLIYATPFPKNPKEISDIANGERELRTKQILVPLSDYALNNIKITLAPKATEASRLIVESLTKELQNASIQDSILKGKIR